MGPFRWSECNGGGNHMARGTVLHLGVGTLERGKLVVLHSPKKKQEKKHCNSKGGPLTHGQVVAS